MVSDTDLRQNGTVDMTITGSCHFGKVAFVIDGVIDPFGNILGLMHSPHYLQTLESGVK